MYDKFRSMDNKMCSTDEIDLQNKQFYCTWNVL